MPEQFEFPVKPLDNLGITVGVDNMVRDANGTVLGHGDPVGELGVAGEDGIGYPDLSTQVSFNEGIFTEPANSQPPVEDVPLEEMLEEKPSKKGKKAPQVDMGGNVDDMLNEVVITDTTKEDTPPAPLPPSLLPTDTQGMFGWLIGTEGAPPRDMQGLMKDINLKMSYVVAYHIAQQLVDLDGINQFNRKVRQYLFNPENVDNMNQKERESRYKLAQAFQRDTMDLAHRFIVNQRINLGAAENGVDAITAKLMGWSDEKLATLNKLLVAVELQEDSIDAEVREDLSGT